MPCQFIQRYIENMVKNNNKYITNIASYTGRPGHRAGLEGVATVTWGSNPEIRNAILHHPNPVPAFNMCSAESALRLNPRPASRSCPAAAAQPGPGRHCPPCPAAPHINLTGPPVKLMLTRSYTDLLQPDPLLSQLVKAAPQSCLAQEGKLLDR